MNTATSCFSTFSTTERRIYLSVLADYNNGCLTGRWIDCDNLEDMKREAAELLRSSKFPNVLVDCPDCEGFGAESVQAGPNVDRVDCPTCKGKGKVPSAEEYAIHDHEGFGRLIGEYTPLATVAAWAEELDKANDPEALIAFASYESRDSEPEEIAGDFREAYLGKFDTLKDWAEDWAEEGGLLEDVPLSLRDYFDWEKWARHQEQDWIFTIDAEPGLYVFQRDY